MSPAVLLDMLCELRNEHKIDEATFLQLINEPHYMKVDADGFVILTREEEELATATPRGLPAPACDWDDSEVTPPNGQPLNCYLCGDITRTTRWGIPICKSCDKMCRRPQ